jgi:hypothetical protein
MISETMPLNKWPLEKLLMLEALLETCVEKNMIPDKQNWQESIPQIIKAVNKATNDAKFELAQLPFNN